MNKSKLLNKTSDIVVLLDLIFDIYLVLAKLSEVPLPRPRLRHC